MSLAKIQQELKAPKNQYNSFGKYSYRSCEDILEAVKLLLAKYDCVLTLSDTIIEVGGRVYVKAEAIFNGGGEHATVTACAREPEDRKGMDASQITGAASSYARKYALNGLFLIDDTKDADTDEHDETVKSKPKPSPKQPKTTPPPKPALPTQKEGCISVNQAKELNKCCKEYQFDVKGFLAEVAKAKGYKVDGLLDIKESDFTDAMNIISPPF